MSNKRGFALLEPEQRRVIAAQGGRKKVPKGFGKLPPEQRKINAIAASTERWRRAKEAQTNKDTGVIGD